METTLHRHLKGLYGIDDSEREVRLGEYRIDAVVDDLLIEVQVASLAAIRRKISDLVQRHRVLVVKPVVIRSYIVRKKSLLGGILGARYSPTVHDPRELFLDFVHFAKVFPHPNLSVEVLLIEQEEERIPRRSWRRGRNFRVTDRKLRSVIDRHRLATAADLLRYLPDNLPMPFTTADLARCAGIPRWLAQKVAYSLRWCGAIDVVGKSRNAVMYQVRKTRQRAA
ncbi:MAG: hypothetical protein ACKVT0_08685 [Planctomycetaceae bacterium]